MTLGSGKKDARKLRDKEDGFSIVVSIALPQGLPQAPNVNNTCGPGIELQPPKARIQDGQESLPKGTESKIINMGTNGEQGLD